MKDNKMVESIIVKAARASHHKFFPRGPFVSVSLAQYGLESDWGKRPSGHNNFFGIQANRMQVAHGDYTVRRTWEHFNGKDIPEEEKFANYASVEAGFDAHAFLLTSSRYEACMTSLNPEAYCDALQECGYATAPNYASALKHLIKTFELEKYDVIG